MGKMKKLLFSLMVCLLAASGAFGQKNVNYTGYGDTCELIKFYKDTLCFTRPFLWNNENKAVLVFADDTANAGHKGDSISFRWGVQLGYFAKTMAGVYCTTYTQAMFIDTFKTTDAGDTARFYNPRTLGGVAATTWNIDQSAETFTPVYGQLDTNTAAKSCIQWHTFSPQWSPCFRFWAQGLAGNKKGSKVRVIFSLQQRMYTITHQQ